MISNIEKFDMTVVLVLADLYTSFPMRRDLLASDFIITDEGEHAEGMPLENEWSLAKNDPYRTGKKFAFDTVTWLIDTGYMRGDLHENQEISNAVLTSKGLEVLKMTPDSLQGTLGDRLLEAAKGSAGAVCGALVSQIAGFSFRLLG